MNVKLAEVIKAKIDTLDTVVDDLSGKIGLGGSGADGAKTVASSENITEDQWYEYSTLTVAASQTLGLAGAGRMLIRCNDKITINGVISVNGKGAAGGAAKSSNSDGAVGSSDSQGGLPSGGGGGGGSSDTFTGGAGGGSTDPGAGAGGSGGAVTGNGGAGGNPNIINNIIFQATPLKFALSLGSGGGSGARYVGGISGAGGVGGGCIVLIAPEIEISNTGSITAHGTLGGNATHNTDGNGGGGGGGSIVIITRKFTNNGSITATGGLGSTVGGDYDGGNGAVGNIVVILV